MRLISTNAHCWIFLKSIFLNARYCCSQVPINKNLESRKVSYLLNSETFQAVSANSPLVYKKQNRVIFKNEFHISGFVLYLAKFHSGTIRIMDPVTLMSLCFNYCLNIY